ncbi:helix-turn-helix transcriptional regulator [Corynebacterium sp.]|uniref:ArsR/SmtB family transcription factor n=1 Tax=Corynebacterium sp. TaxID=1720 RepID=UPI0026DB021D|nr:helix-turn-helix transcriptional regulator [Corynebacterium sp.]MDO5031027.1 helix-turn-helix transcriptional regulator [Corynebacterium sp.]
MSIADSVLDEDNAQHLAHTFRALANPIRLHILSVLAAKHDHSWTSERMQQGFGLSQSTVHYHLAALQKGGLVVAERSRPSSLTTYTLNDATFRQLRELFHLARRYHRSFWETL